MQKLKVDTLLYGACKVLTYYKYVITLLRYILVMQIVIILFECVNIFFLGWLHATAYGMSFWSDQYDPVSARSRC